MPLPTDPQSLIDGLSLEDKILPHLASDDFACYFTDHPQALVELAWFLGQQPGGLTAARVAALACWMGKMGMAEDFRFDCPEGQRATLGWARSGPEGLLVTADSDGTASLEEVDDDALEEVRLAEQAWLRSGREAPVVVVEFRGQGQGEDGDGDIIPSTEDSQDRWDGTADLVALDPEHRNACCEMDSDSSDGLRDSSAASTMAREWNGPFAMAAKLHRPSAKLVALRAALGLEAGLPAITEESAAPLRPRM